MASCNSLSQLKAMMTDFKRGTEKQGPTTHSDKTKRLNIQGSNKRRKREPDETKVEVLPMKGIVKYLGQMISFADQETIEMRRRV